MKLFFLLATLVQILECRTEKLTTEESQNFLKISTPPPPPLSPERRKRDAGDTRTRTAGTALRQFSNGLPNYGTYVGEVTQADIPSGWGRFQFQRRRTNEQDYGTTTTVVEGFWRYGHVNSSARITDGQGAVYIGEVREEGSLVPVRHGSRESMQAKGFFFDSSYYNNHNSANYDCVPQGEGTMFYRNGCRYVGGWRNGERNGKGTLPCNGTVYVGDFTPSEYTYIVKNSQGSIEWGDGSKYVGGWFVGIERASQRRHGTVSSNPSDNIIPRRMGKGNMTWAATDECNGSKYEGDWWNDVLQGEGTMMYRDGRVYVGGWKGNKKEGYGVLKSITGEVLREGFWIEDSEGFGI